jgi:hypothetical protein
MIKSAALINEVDGDINSKTLISESGIHTTDTTIKFLFSHTMFGYICHPSLFEKAESLNFT